LQTPLLAVTSITASAGEIYAAEIKKLLDSED
jgi:hypothetical protein